MSDRIRDAAIQLVRALRSDEDVRRIQRVERAIDNQGNPILDNITLVAGGGGGGTVIVAWGAITGTLTDQADLAAALDSKVTLNGLEWTIVTGSIADLQDDVSDLQSGKADVSHTHSGSDITSGIIVPARLGSGSPSASTFLRGDGQWTTLPGGSAAWGSITGTLSNQTDLQNALDAKVTLGGVDWTIVTGTLSSLQDDVADLQSGKADVGHVHAASDVTSGTFHVDRIPALTIAKITGLQSALDGKADDLDITLLSAAVSDLQTNKADASHTHNASDINAGTLADARIPNLNASKITAGTFADARIPNLAASKITSGTFNEARIPSLPISRITNLQSTLDGKVDTSWHQFRSLSSSFTTTSSSMQTVTGLNLAVPANSKWQITYALPIGCSGAGGMDIGVIAPSGSDMTAMLVASEGAQGSSAMVPAMVISPGAFGVAIGKSAYTFGIASGVATITAIVEVGGTSGNISLQVRSITSGQTSAVAATDARLAAIQIG